MAHHMPPHMPSAPLPPPHPMGGMGSPMPHMQELFGQMSMDSPHGPPQHMGGSPPNMRPMIHNIDLPMNVSKVPTIYEAFMYTKLDDGPGLPPSWSRAVRTPIPVSQEAMASKARKMANSRTTTVKDVLLSKVMAGSRRKQIEDLIQEKNMQEIDQRYEWKPAYIDIAKRMMYNPRAKRVENEIYKMEVIIKRIPKVVQYTNGPRLHQPLGAEIVDVNGFGHGQGHHGMGAMYPRPQSSYGDSQGQPMIEIAPGPRHFDQHGPQHPGQGFHGPPPPPPHNGGPHHGGPAMVEVVHDHHEAHDQHPKGPPKPKQGKQYHGEHEHFGGQDDHHGGHGGHGSPMKSPKKSLGRIDVHNSKTRGKVEKWHKATYHDSSSDSSDVFDYSDNETALLTPSSSVSSREHKYEKHRRSSSRDRRDSRGSHNYKIIQPRQHCRRSPHHQSGHRRSSTYEDEGFVVLQTTEAVREGVRKGVREGVREAAVATAALQRSIPVRTTERPPLSRHAYTYDDRIPHEYEAGRVGRLGGPLTRRASEVRRVPDYRDHLFEERLDISRDIRGQEMLEREMRDLEFRDREFRERELLDRDRLKVQELADLRRREMQDRAGYGGRSGVRFGPSGY